MIEIQMSGPGKNALGSEMMRFLLVQLRAAAGRPVLLTGSGDAFCAGLNLKEVVAAEGDAMLELLGLLEECVSALHLYPGPTVAAVNGHAIAGGCVLALCCDHRVMTTNPRARIGLNEVALGVRFPPRTLAAVRRRLPPHRASRVILGADLVDAPAALSLSLVDEIAESPVEVARVRLGVLAAHPADAYAAAKAELHGAVPGDLCPDDVYERRLRELAAHWAGPATREKLLGVLAR